jgi:hypothetical protein
MYPISFFSGYTGVGLNAQSQQDSLIPNLGAEAFFAGQFSLMDLLLLRMELSVATENNILSDGIFQKTESLFSVDEVSVTMQRNSGKYTFIGAAFLGEYESIGSDLFLQRLFGIDAIGSKITETWQGLSGATIYPFSGIGGAYVMKFPQPIAGGIYGYINKEYATSTDGEVTETLILNADARFAGAWDSFTVDSAFGVSFPIKRQYTAYNEQGEEVTTDVTLLIDHVDLHGGFSVLIGNRYISSFFLQGGISKLQINPAEGEKVLELSDVYILCEPRFKTDYLQINFTLFNIPTQMQTTLFYVDNPLGCNVSVYSNQIYINGLNITAGSHLTLGANFVSGTTEIDQESLSLQLAPFASMNLLGGKFDIALKLNLLQLPVLADNLSLTVGYRVQL